MKVWKILQKLRTSPVSRVRITEESKLSAIHKMRHQKNTEQMLAISDSWHACGRDADNKMLAKTVVELMSMQRANSVG